MNDQTFMKEQPVSRLLWKMSLPMVISMMVNSLYNIVDSYYVAQISEKAMTALSLVYPVQNLVNAVTIGFGVGLNAVISYHLGAQESRKADQAASQGFLLSLIHGIALTVISIWIMPVFLPLFTSDAEVISLGVRYSRVVFLFATVISMTLFYEKLFQSVGRMAVSMFCMMCGCIANIILDPVLIYGYGPFPVMGIEGAALATGIGQVLTLILYLAVHAVRPLQVNAHIRQMGLTKDMCRRLYGIGIPAVLNLALPSLLTSALNAILAGYSQIYVVVLGVYYKLQTFLYLPANGIVQGMRPLIGYNYGAKEQERVRRIYRTALGAIILIMGLGTVLCLAIPEPLMGLFAESQETVGAGAKALRIICAGFLVSSVSVTTCGALEGLGMGGPSLRISLLRYAVVMIPAAWLLSLAFGAEGVWHAFWISELLTAVASVFILRKAMPRQD
ncbi:MATE family efflux transporter [Lachnoclostridium sp. An196]|uniref:MATE family efflux transporter n=1 Tax=Lachnoclostridium sp. An196 TaxID=1965583 RepID=UPI000B37F695|nr:MATE family efflux transporter [Lachnoclostridium sp. An196]OUP17860.1 MATE family efflux transporter [Lachnoclostridium sp. An196]